MKVNFFLIAYTWSYIKLGLALHVPLRSEQLRFHDHQHDRHTNHEYLQQLQPYYADGNLQRTTSHNYGLGLHDQYNNVDQQPIYHHATWHLKGNDESTKLAEFAKDPNNLLNGIYHDGVVTYDLGLPKYEILNPYDPPEIITAGHPHYEQHLNHIKLTKNFTIENFGVISMLGGSDTIYEITDPITTTTIATTTDEPAETATTKTSISTISPQPSMEKYKNMNSDIERHLEKTKEKLQKLNDELELNNKNREINATAKKLNKHLKSISFSSAAGQPTTLTESTNNYSQSKSHINIPIEAETFDKDHRFVKTVRGHSVLLPAIAMSPPIDSQLHGNPLSPTLYTDRAHLSFATTHHLNSHLKLPFEEDESNFERLYRSATENSLEESSPSTDAVE